MRIDIISAVPKLFDGFLNESIIHKAQQKGVAELNVIDLRDFSVGNYKQIDDAPYGGGAGMVLMPGPLAKAIEQLQSQVTYDEIIFFVPEGSNLNQAEINKYSQMHNLLIVCGHYKGIDQRIVDQYATQLISIGDFVVTGGEIPAALFCDAVVRVIPGAIGNEVSALEDSFQDHLLSPPVYTRPPVFQGREVPDILLSGNHQKIQDWKLKEAQKKTEKYRPDMLKP